MIPASKRKHTAAIGGGRASQRRLTALTWASHMATSAEDTSDEYIRSLPAQVNAVRASSFRRSVQTDSLDILLDTLSRRIEDIVGRKIDSVLSANRVVDATTVDSGVSGSVPTAAVTVTDSSTTARDNDALGRSNLDQTGAAFPPGDAGVKEEAIRGHQRRSF